MIYLNYISNGAIRYFFDDYELYVTGTESFFKSGYHVRYGGRRHLSLTTGYATGYDFYFYDLIDSYPSGRIYKLESGVYYAGGVLNFRTATGYITGHYDTFFYDTFEAYSAGSISTLNLGVASGDAGTLNGTILPPQP